MPLEMGMYVVWLSPDGCGGFTGISWDAEKCSGFTPPEAALVTVASGEVWCNSGKVGFKEQEREICIDRIQIWQWLGVRYRISSRNG